MTANIDLMKPSRELDALVYSFVFQRAVAHDGQEPYDAIHFNEHLKVPPYSSDIAAAWEVVEKMDRDRWVPTIRKQIGGAYEVIFWNWKTYKEYFAVAESPAVAICVAALRAEGVVDE